MELLQETNGYQKSIEHYSYTYSENFEKKSVKYKC